MEEIQLSSRKWCIPKCKNQLWNRVFAQKAFLDISTLVNHKRSSSNLLSFKLILLIQSHWVLHVRLCRWVHFQASNLSIWYSSNEDTQGQLLFRMCKIMPLFLSIVFVYLKSRIINLQCITPWPGINFLHFRMSNIGELWRDGSLLSCLSLFLLRWSFWSF